MSDEIKKLIEAVDSGDQEYIYKFEYDGCGLAMEGHTRSTIRAAFHGGLDAAKALHDSLLPGWDLQISTYEDDSFEVTVAPPLRVKAHYSVDSVIARAWLLAILKARAALDGLPI